MKGAVHFVAPSNMSKALLMFHRNVMGQQEIGPMWVMMRRKSPESTKCP